MVNMSVGIDWSLSARARTPEAGAGSNQRIRSLANSWALFQEELVDEPKEMLNKLAV